MITPGFIVKNDTIWPLQISLNHVGPLYYDVIQPGESFVRSTGAVAFTLKASVFLDEKDRITDWDAIIPVATLVGTVILSAVTAGAAAYASGPALAVTSMAGLSGVTGLSSASALATATAASALAGAGFSTGAALFIGGAVVAGTGTALSATATAALKDIFKNENISVNEVGCYAGEPFPFQTEVTPWRITGGPTFRKVEGKDLVEIVGAPLKLEKVSLVSGVSDETLLDELGAKSYKEETKKILITNIRNSDTQLKLAKEAYGDGVSVKGLLVNIAGRHFLKMINLLQESGKNWTDPKCLQPTSNVDPLRTSAFFHAKSDGAAKGSRAGVTYRVLDENSVILGVISIAWENPYQGDFVYCIKISKSRDLLQSCLDYCNNSNKSKIEGDDTIKVSEEKLKELILPKVFNAHTAYLLLGIKTDDLVKDVLQA